KPYWSLSRGASRFPVCPCRLQVQTISDSGSSSLSKLKSVSSEANPQTYILDHIMDRFTVIYGSIVSVLSITFAIYLIILYRNNLADKWKEIGHKVLLILVLACPCALCLAEALPNSLTIIKLINKKIFVMRGRILETLTKLKFLAFDKTGTLTNGQFRVHNCHRLNESNDKLLKLIAIGELKFGNHPIAVAIYNYVTGVINVTSNYRNKDLDMIYSNDLILNNQPGLGFSYDIEGHTIYIGSNEWMKINGISLCEIEETVNQDLTQVYAAIDHKLVFIFYLFDTPRPSASAAIQKLKNKKIDVGIISGDGRGPTYQSYKIVDADEYNYSHTPREKMNYIRNKNKSYKNCVGMVGDGVNDAPALLEAGIGMSIGENLSEMVRKVSDIIFVSDNLIEITETIAQSNRYVIITIQNIIIAILPKIGITVITVVLKNGQNLIWMEILTDSITVLIIIINSLRIIIN
ncbi:hypothetical protein HZS_6205, partial [Henneguya salminicola]